MIAMLTVMAGGTLIPFKDLNFTWYTFEDYLRVQAEIRKGLTIMENRPPNSKAPTEARYTADDLVWMEEARQAIAHLDQLMNEEQRLYSCT